MTLGGTGGLLVETTRMRMFHGIALAAALTVAGCASPPKDPTFQAENALATAGFDLKMADTPAKLERIKKLPQHQLVKAKLRGARSMSGRTPRPASVGIQAMRMPIGACSISGGSKRSTSAPGGIRTKVKAGNRARAEG